VISPVEFVIAEMGVLLHGLDVGMPRRFLRQFKFPLARRTMVTK
jgi:hypothetical protein